MSPPVLVLGHAADLTGPPVYLRHLLRWLRANRPHERVEVALLSGGEMLDELAELASVTVFEPLPSEVADPEVAALIASGEVDEQEWWARARRDALAEMMAPFGHAEVVHVNGAPAVELAAALPSRPRVLVSHVHELEVGLTHRLPPHHRELFVGGATRIFSVAQAVTDNLVARHGVDPGIVEQHPGMVEAHAIAATAATVDRDAELLSRGIDPAHHVVGACGTIEFRKGTDHFLHLAWHLRRANLDRPVTFVWIGGDDEGIELARSRAESLEVDDVVRFVGATTDPIRWFALLDVFVMPSREDPFPLVCLEAAAAGAPIATFDAGGIPELVDQGCGIVVPYPDVQALAAGVAAVLEDEQRRSAMGARGQELAAARHDVSVLAPQLWQALDRWR